MLAIAIYVLSLANPLVVQTNSGPIEGRFSSEFQNVTEFLGIPYAKPPVGPLRWAPPQPPEPWSPILSTQNFGDACVQPFFETQYNVETGVGYFFGPQSEDCLTLNVWRHEACESGCSLPVLVWIHGGAFILGSSSFPTYNGAVLASTEEIIVVSINYRLGPLGFLVNEELIGDDNKAVNFGIQDQVLALQWVQDNIEAFGGDPTKVTVWGESAGSISIFTLLTMDSAAGLFHRVFMQSGTNIQAPENMDKYSTQVSTSTSFINSIGCTTLDCARDVSIESIRLFGASYSWWIVADGNVVPDPYTAIQTGAVHEVDILSGTVKDEGTIFVNLGALDTLTYSLDIYALFGTTVAPKVLKKYPASSYLWPGQAEAAVFGDWFFNCPAKYFLKQYSKAGFDRNIYSFVFEHFSSWILSTGDIQARTAQGVAHSSANTYFFGAPFFSFTEEESALSESMRQSLTQFVATGTIDLDGLVWDQWDEKDEHYLKITTESSISTKYRGSICEFWEEFPPYEPSTSSASTFGTHYLWLIPTLLCSNMLARFLL